MTHSRSRLRAGPRRAAAALVAGTAGLCLAAAFVPAPAAAHSASVPPRAQCPEDLEGRAVCYAGKDAHGAHYTIAVPDDWNGDLVMHAHGGPDLGDPTPERSAEDLERWSVMVKEGYAWAGSSYRRGGYGARMAAADTENLRRFFDRAFGTPRRTLLHGQSWGGNVAAKAAETYASSYDGVLLTNGALAGGSRGYNHRVDLRVVYQY